MLGSALGEMLCVISPKPDGECCGCPGHAELLNLVPSYQTATSQWLPAVLVPGALCREVSWLGCSSVPGLRVPSAADCHRAKGQDGS